VLPLTSGRKKGAKGEERPSHDLWKKELPLPSTKEGKATLTPPSKIGAKKKKASMSFAGSRAPPVKKDKSVTKSAAGREKGRRKRSSNLRGRRAAAP